MLGDLAAEPCQDLPTIFLCISSAGVVLPELGQCEWESRVDAGMVSSDALHVTWCTYWPGAFNAPQPVSHAEECSVPPKIPQILNEFKFPAI